MVYKKGLVASKFTCGLLVGGLCPGAPPSIARAYQNGVIRVDDLLVAVNGTVRAAGARAARRARAPTTTTRAHRVILTCARSLCLSLLLAAARAQPSGKMKPDPKWKPSTDDANTSEKVPLELAYPKDAAVTADALEAAVKDDRRPRDLTFIRVIKPEAEESDEED